MPKKFHLCSHQAEPTFLALHTFKKTSTSGVSLGTIAIPLRNAVQLVYSDDGAETGAVLVNGCHPTLQKRNVDASFLECASVFGAAFVRGRCLTM